MDSSLRSLCPKFLFGLCRRWWRRTISCLIIAMTLIFLWLHTQIAPIKQNILPKPIVSKENVMIKISTTKNFSFIPKPIIYSGESNVRRGVCSNLKPPKEVLVDIFQPIDGSVNSYFFSAYYDNRNHKSEVRIIGVRSKGDEMWCQLWYLNNDEFYVESHRASITVVPEGSGRLYESVWVICPSSSHPSPPKIVSVATKECAVPSNYLNINPVITERPKKYSFSLCVTPFNLNYDKVDEFLEIMALNEMFGMEHAYFYNYSSSNRIRRITEALVKEGRATVIQWHLPMKVHVWPVPPGYVEEIKYFGQMAMFQDCLMRGMGRYQYLVYTDMDELAVPRRHRTWHELFNARNFDRRQPAAVIFRNTFFKLEWPSDPKSLMDKEIVASNSRALLKTKREKTIYTSGARSKYMIDPLQVHTCGVHNIWQMEKSGGDLEVLSVDDGVLHHYRNWEGLGEKTFVVDDNMLRFRDEIINRLRKKKDWFRNLSKS